MKPMYATDWHQCFTCGLTRPDSELTKGTRKDVVLGMTETIYGCKDPIVCARFKQFREESTKREQEDLQLELAAAVIEPRNKRRKAQR